MTDKLPLVVDPVLKQIREISAGEQLPAEILANALTLALTGLTTADSGVVTATDNLLQAIGKVQGQLNNKVGKDGSKVLSSNDFTNDERVKLANIAEQATKNATDDALRDRSTHTGTQPASTITGLGTAAPLDVTTSQSDSTFGRIPRLGDGALSEFSGVTKRDFLNGTLVYTSLNVEGELPFLVEIKGNGYADGVVKATISGYIYQGGIIVTSGETNNRNLHSVNLFLLNGMLCFWFARMGYWSGFQFRVTGQLAVALGQPNSPFTYASSGHKNLVVGVYDSTMPTGAVASVAVALRRYLFLEDAASPIASGGIIERGSNANGEYTKFADGTLICTAKKGVAYETANFTNSTLWVFPSQFSTAPKLTIQGGLAGSGTIVCVETSNSTTACTFRGYSIHNPLDNDSAGYVSLIAVGTWK